MSELMDNIVSAFIFLEGKNGKTYWCSCCGREIREEDFGNAGEFRNAIETGFCRRCLKECRE